VLLHAVVDALLGASALGDIGQMFPDTDPANRGRDSGEMLRAARDAIVAIGCRIINIDCIVFAQRPKLLPYRQLMRQRMADLLEIEPERIGLKSKTGEHIGPVGEEDAIEALCVALLEIQ
jgi:2-C-methyl-D-erythritol 2,4-cyclodiphosphate synthase